MLRGLLLALLARSPGGLHLAGADAAGDEVAEAEADLLGDGAIVARADGVHIKRFQGRVGNNLLQLEHALVFAERSGAQRVVLPPDTAGKQGKKKGTTLHPKAHVSGVELKDIFALPAEIVVKNRLDWRASDDVCRTRNASAQQGWLRNFNACTNFTFPEGVGVLRQYVRPFLRPEVREAVRARQRDPRFKDSLTIHLRSHDVFADPIRSTHRQPPCALYDKIIKSGVARHRPFRHVYAVTQSFPKKKTDDRKDRWWNPCINATLERHPAGLVTVHSGSLAEDAASILAAQHLVASQSSFCLQLAKLSSNLKRLYLTSGRDFYSAKFDDGCVARVESLVYDLPDFGDRNVRGQALKREEVMRWMLDYAPEDIPEPRKPCGDSPGSAPFRLQLRRPFNITDPEHIKHQYGL